MAFIELKKTKLWIRDQISTQQTDTFSLELVILMKDISDFFFNSCRVMDFLTDDTFTYRD